MAERRDMHTRPVALPEPSNVAKDVILSLITCGLWDIFWQYKQMQAVNMLLGRKEFSFFKWLVFTILTCGLYHIYHEYLMGRAIVEIQHQYGLPTSESLPAVSIVLALISLGIITDALQQKELNYIIEQLQAKHLRPY